MAGGVTLLTVMLLYLEPLTAIPLHGVVQLLSNGSRTWIQRAHVRRAFVWRYALPLLPMGFVGLAIAQQLPDAALKVAIAVFVLVATWAPGRLLLGTHPEQIDAGRRFLLLGGVVGVLNVSIGAVGPLIAPFYLNLGLSRFELVGTKAASQTLAHLAKLAVFGAVGFAFAEWWPLLAALGVAVVLGTALGSRLLHRVSEPAFVALYKAVLTAMAGWLLLRQLL